MKLKILSITGAMTLVVLFGSFVYAGGMGGGGMGGGGHGMMGGGHMMDYGRGYSPPYQDQYNRYDQNNRYNEPEKSYRHDPGETERLRQEIREKRRELSALYRSENPDRDQIDKRIDELGRLEAELDRKLSEPEYQRR